MILVTGRTAMSRSTRRLPAAAHGRCCPRVEPQPILRRPTGRPVRPRYAERLPDVVEAVFLIWPFFKAEAVLAFLDVVTKHARRIVYPSSEGVGDDLEQQTDTITVRIAAELAA
jgi:hypothetical protein